MSDAITNEIKKLQNKIAELEQIRLQKELEEENAKTPTFEYYIKKLFDFIKTKNDAVNENYNMTYGGNKTKTNNNINIQQNQHRHNEIIKQHNAEYVPALEHIYSALYDINERLTKLENV